MLTIATRLLVLGPGPAALVAAKTAASRGLPCLLAGHEPIDVVEPVALDDEALEALRPDGVLDVLRPYASAQEPFAIAPLHFEQGLKHHCVADMLVTVYDRMWFEADRQTVDGARVSGSLTDGSSRWALTTDAVFDATAANPSDDLNAAIVAGARFSAGLVNGS